MQGIRRSFHTAFWALILALGLPFVVFMFGMIRHRQLQSTANPRWAQFAKVTGFSSATKAETSDVAADVDSVRLPVRTASILSESSSPADSVRHSASDTSLTGSIAGRRSIEIPVRSPSGKASTPERQQTTHRETAERRTSGLHPTIDDDDSHMAESTSRLESRVKDVCERLDQLAQQQNKQQSQNVHVQTQLLQREAAIADAIKNLNETATSQFSAVQAMTSEIHSNGDEPDNRARRDSWVEHSSAEESFQNPIILAIKPSAEPTSPPPPTRTSPTKESIRISRKFGRDKVAVFTMDVRDADVRQFFSKLSDVARVNIVPSPEVTGLISLNVRETSFENALKAIVKSRGYFIEHEGNIVIIRTADEAIRLKQQNRSLHIKAD